jgi:hypothetical protein
MDASLPAIPGAGCATCPSACQQHHDDQGMELVG